MNIMWRAAILIAVLLALLVSAQARAQTDVTVEIGPQAPNTTFGVGGFFRPSEFTAIRVKLTSQLNEATPVWVQWQVPNADGDIEERGRSLTLTPNQSALTWLYAWLPHDVTLNTVWTIRVFEERDGVRRRELGGTRISPGPAGAQLVDLPIGMIAVIGDRRLGLDGYANTNAIRNQFRPAGGHEDTRIISGLKPNELPDRWESLLPFEAIAWGGDGVPPQDLSLDQANALREYVRWGGHLIITLRPEGNDWGFGTIGGTQLENLLPYRTLGSVPARHDAVGLADLLPVLSKYNDVNQLQTSSRRMEFSIRAFGDVRARKVELDNFYEPLIALPDGRVVAIQRTFGHGRVTVIGIDLSDGRLASLGLPQADAFWNRILGRRMDTPTGSEIIALEKLNRLATNYRPLENSLGSGALITGGGAGGINLTGPANIGLLLAFVLFVAYWLVAGPLGFALLKSYGQVRHAWIAFAGCVALFTAIAWSSVGLVPKSTTVKHITILDHIARDAGTTRPGDDQLQRALSFFSVYLPDYGKTEVALDPDSERRNLLTSWVPPLAPVQYFPNPDRYPIDVARSPHQFEIPSRSTSTQMMAHWMGGVDPKWGGMLRVVRPIEVSDESGSGSQIRGAIVNELPGTLRNVSVIWVRNNRLIRRRYDPQIPATSNSTTGIMPNSGSFWRLGNFQFNKGVTLDLDKQLQGPSRLEQNIKSRYVDQYANQGLIGPAANKPIEESDRRNFIEMLSFFHLLTPPPYIKQTESQTFSDEVVFSRHMGREMDLSAWFTRPCLIIIGYLDNSECPVPLRIDGDDQPPDSTGLTVVRWIYPLPVDEKIAFREVFEPAESAEQPEGDSQ